MTITVEQLAQVISGQVTAGAESVTAPLGPSEMIPSRCAGQSVLWDVAGQDSEVGKDLPSTNKLDCQVVVTANPEFACPPRGWRILVADVAQALNTFAAWRRKQFRGELVAVVGRGEATPVVDALRQLGQTRFAETRMEFRDDRAAFRDQVDPLGVLLALANLEDQPLAVIRCDDANDLQICQPDVAVFTAAAESSNSATLTGISKQLESLKPETVAVIPSSARLDDDAGVSVPHVTTYGREADADVCIRQVEARGGTLSFFANQTQFQVPLWGRRFAPAMAAAIAVARSWGMPDLEIVTTLAKLPSHAAGCSVFQHAGVTLIDASPCHDGDSLRGSLELLREARGVDDELAQANPSDCTRTGPKITGRRIVVSGDLSGPAEHDQAIARLFGEQIISVCGADLLLAAGGTSADIVAAAHEAGMPSGAARAFEQADEIILRLRAILRHGDVVLFQGNSASGVRRMIESIKQETIPLPEADVAFPTDLPTASSV